MNESYKIHEFARLAGVTVKALRHYDRLGLLKPARTASGYRVYAERDLETLEQKQVLLARAIRAVRAAKESLESGKPANPAVLKK